MKLKTTPTYNFLQKESFTYEEFSHTHIKTNISKKNFRFCTFRNVSFLKLNIEKACRFIDCYFRWTKFTNINFTGSKFIDCNLRKSSFDNCILDYVMFQDSFVEYSAININSYPSNLSPKRLLLKNLRSEAIKAMWQEDADKFYVDECANNIKYYKSKFDGTNSHYKTTLERKDKNKARLMYCFLLLYGTTIGFGIKLHKIILTALFSIFIFANIYCHTGFSESNLFYTTLDYRLNSLLLATSQLFNISGIFYDKLFSTKNALIIFTLSVNNLMGLTLIWLTITKLIRKLDKS